uniref:SET domain-containing protein n=1 Tax=Eucampia antarctica TaxID=49252 RepID=A0A7S2WE23_9STRA
MGTDNGDVALRGPIFYRKHPQLLAFTAMIFLIFSVWELNEKYSDGNQAQTKNNNIQDVNDTNIVSSSKRQIRGASDEFKGNEEWRDYSRGNFLEKFDCEELWEKENPVHDQETWKRFRQAYESVVESSDSTVGDTLADFDAFTVKHYASQSPGKGRGVYAKEKIPSGKLLYNFSRSAQFKDGKSFREFLMRLDNELACDVLQWSYVINLGEDSDDIENDLRIVCDLDEGSFCNNGGHKHGNMGYASSDTEKFPRYNRMRPLFATRDIEPGEEILCKYGEFSNGDWEHFGF